MERLLKWIGYSIFIGWTIAILVNFSIYQHTTSMIGFLSPLVEGILFMALMFGIYFFVVKTFKKNQNHAITQLLSLGGISIITAVVLAF